MKRLSSVEPWNILHLFGSKRCDTQKEQLVQNTVAQEAIGMPLHSCATPLLYLVTSKLPDAIQDALMKSFTAKGLVI